MEDFQLLFKINENELTGYIWRNYKMQRPEIVSFVQRDGDQIVGEPQQLKYFIMPEPTLHPLDLNEGFENFTFRNESSTGMLSKQEKYNVKNNIRNLKSGTEERYKIYTNRSILSHIMVMPYNCKPLRSDEFSLCVTKFDDIIYIVKKRDNNDNNCKRTKNDSYHAKFEQCSFSDSPATQPKTDIPVDARKSCFCAYRTRLENFEFLIFGSTAGVISDQEIKDLTNLKNINKCCFVLTKLLWQLPPNDNRKWQSHPIIKKWWAEAYLKNVSDIFIGFKDSEGYIRQPIEHLNVDDMAKNKNWKKEICVGFLNKFLTMATAKMSNLNCPYTVYEFRHDHSNKCIKYKIHKGKSEFSFLTEEFIAECTAEM